MNTWNSQVFGFFPSAKYVGSFPLNSLKAPLKVSKTFKVVMTLSNASSTSTFNQKFFGIFIQSYNFLKNIFTIHSITILITKTLALIDNFCL